MSKNQKDTLYQVAKMYYIQNKTQAEISKVFNTSRPTISRYLKEARDQGIVNISLNFPWDRDLLLEKEFKNRFDLKEVQILKSNGQNDQETIKGLGYLAANYLDSIIRDEDIVFCSYGRTVASTIQALNPNRKLGITVVQMIGALGAENQLMDGPDLVRLLSEKYGGEYKYLLAPLVLQNREARDGLINQVRFKQAMSLSHDARIGLCGIGSMEEETPSPIWQNYIDITEWNYLNSIGAKAHMVASFLDQDGNILDDEINDRVIGLNMERVKSIPYMIAVAGGRQKAHAISAVLRGQYISVLITDDTAAERILAESQDRS